MAEQINKQKQRYDDRVYFKTISNSIKYKILSTLIGKKIVRLDLKKKKSNYTLYGKYVPLK